MKLVEAALRFPFGHPSVVCVIPGAAHPREVARNLRTLGAAIPRALWTSLNAAGLIRRDAPARDSRAPRSGDLRKRYHGGSMAETILYGVEPNLAAPEFIDMLVRSTLAERRPIGLPSR